MKVGVLALQGDVREQHFKVMFANMLVLSLPAVLIQYQFVVSKNSTALTLW